MHLPARESFPFHKLFALTFGPPRSYLGKAPFIIWPIGVKNSYAIQVALEESNGWHRVSHRPIFLTNNQSVLMN